MIKAGNLTPTFTKNSKPIKNFKTLRPVMGRVLPYEVCFKNITCLIKTGIILIDIYLLPEAKPHIVKPYI